VLQQYLDAIDKRNEECGSIINKLEEKEQKWLEEVDEAKIKAEQEVGGILHFVTEKEGDLVPEGTRVYVRGDWGTVVKTSRDYYKTNLKIRRDNGDDVDDGKVVLGIHGHDFLAAPSYTESGPPVFITEEEKAQAPERVQAKKDAEQRVLDQKLELTTALHHVTNEEAHLAPIGMRVYVEGDNDFFWAKVSNTGTYTDGTPWVELYQNGYGVPVEDPFRGDARDFTFTGTSRYVKAVYVNLAGDSISHLLPPEDFFKDYNPY